MPDRRVLFVCTGNLCRSPMAEAIADQGWGSESLRFGSAGVLAVEGAPATRAARLACEEAGADLSGHRARQFTAEMADGADEILVMSVAHLRRVREIAPEAGDKAALLRPDGAEVDDPYGLPVEVYRATRDEITAALEARLGPPVE